MDLDNITTSNNCILAKDIILSTYAQVARIIMILFNTVPIILFVFLILVYKRYRLALHGNLKIIYIFIVFNSICIIIGYFLVELRNIFLTISDPSGSNPCAMLCPLWYALITRGFFGFMFSFSLPLLHFCAMLERWRATKLAKNYENEGNYFGILIVISVMLISLIYLIIYVYIVLDDFNMEWNKMLAYNATVTVRSNILTIYQSYFMLFFLALTALGDYLLLRKNGRLRKMVFITNANQQTQSNGYSLAENYQFNENLLAIRFILPLDIAYGLSYSIYFGLVIILRSFQPIIPFSVFLANYNLITIIFSRLNVRKKLKKSTIFELFDISSVSMNSSLLNKNPVEESEYCFTENFKPVIPSQSPNNSSVPIDTSFENKKPDKMQRLLDELEEEFEKQNAGKAEGKKEAPPRRSYKLSPINPIKRSIARRKILQIIPETPEKQNENSQKGEKDNSFEVVKQTPIGKISSVYFLWSHPTIFPTLNILHSTFGFLQKGADLMLPGIELINQFPIFEENSIVAISTINQNKEVGGEGISTICGPMAVGRALFSSEEMKQKRETGQKGKAVEILHIFGDYLWEFGSKRSFPQFIDKCPTQQPSPDVELTDNLNILLNDCKDLKLEDDLLQMVVKYFLPDIFPTKIIVQKLCEAMTKAILVKTAEGKELIYRGKVPYIEFKVNEVTELLIEYGILKKFIKGIDLGIKEKKKK
ncbi:hypothetical protein Mgra_00007982 [Meloidogyne graminicola]|uniref:Eukaryotic translation initiation factor 2D-like PUA RNA-binding domain-containing protein n=1 Tax=Meloidogyne graminicola TaxID=189291 RepID=A0A8S9ZH19_9BILA|nr:hypothetical protein Mgra_00007982 [Meloidogyne graminicola]